MRSFAPADLRAGFGQANAQADRRPSCLDPRDSSDAPTSSPAQSAPRSPVNPSSTPSYALPKQETRSRSTTRKVITRQLRGHFQSAVYENPRPQSTWRPRPVPAGRLLRHTCRLPPGPGAFSAWLALILQSLCLPLVSLSSWPSRSFPFSVFQPLTTGTSSQKAPGKMLCRPRRISLS